MKQKLSRWYGLAALTVSVASVVAGATVASADPVGAPTYRALSGVGSDTIQGVMDAMSNTVSIGGTLQIGSYDATGSANITTKNPAVTANCTIPRPNGSGAGINALLASLQPGATDAGCLDFARSSKAPSGTTSPHLTYVPMALDAVTYAITANSTIPRQLTLSQLQQIYQCNPAYVGTGPNYSITVYLPQAGSGTRAFWESAMGITDAQVTAGDFPCITDTKNGQPVEEHDGRVLDSNSIAPFSIAQYNAQSEGVIPDIRGQAILGQIDGNNPDVLNANFGIKREVYNVIPSSDVGVAPWSTVFVGSNSLICQQSQLINTYGFALDPQCGATNQGT